MSADEHLREALRSALVAWRDAERAMTNEPPGTEAWHRAKADYQKWQATYRVLADRVDPDRRAAPGSGLTESG